MNSFLECIANGNAALDSDACANVVEAAFSGCADTSSHEDLDVLTRVKEAIIAERVDLYLQPIVSLPQRKTRYFEAFSRLRDARGQVLKPATYIEAAERANRIGVIDNLILTRCIDAIRRYGREDPHLVVFCNLSPTTLFDTEFFEAFTSYLEANADLASRLIFEFTYPSIHMMHPRVEEKVAEIAARGFAFSLDHVHRLDLDWDALGRRNFRFVKVSAATLQRTMQVTHIGEGGVIAPRDLRKRLMTAGIDLIAEKIEAEGDMPPILSMGLDFGQGHLFGAPRKAESYLTKLSNGAG